MTTAADQPVTDLGSPFEIPDEELRTRALLALRQGRFDLAEKLLVGKDVDQAALVESLRIYQAELEIQNEELQRSYHQTQGALSRFMAFFNSLPMPELVVDGQGLVKEANEEARRLFGLRDTAFHQYFFVRLIDEPHRGPVIQALSQLRPDEPIDLHELRFRTKRNEVFIGDLHMVALPSEEDEGRRLLCAVVDRTEAVLQREALRESRERYRVIAEFSSDWEYWIGPDGRYRYVSPACTRLTGYPSAAFVADADLFRRLLHPDDRRHWERHLEAHLGDESGGIAPLELRIRHLDGHEHWIEHSCTPVFGESGDFLGRRGVNRDITELKRSREQLHFLAQHDALTGLPNRSLFRQRLEEAIPRTIRRGGETALLFLDLDRFKTVNDTLGHPVGDLLLKQVAARLMQSVRASDTVARLGGDEFVVISEDVQEPNDAAILAKRLLDLFATPFDVEGRELFLSLSIGIGIYPLDGADADTLIRHADIAMYRAKAAGRNGFRFFDPEMSEGAAERLRLEQELRNALLHNELMLEYQPQVSLPGGELCGVEVLCRWDHPRLGLLSPGHFLPLAHDIGVIDQLDLWVLEHACAQVAAWDRGGFTVPRLAVNLSVHRIQGDDVPEQIESILARTDLDPRRLELELTEASLMGSPTGTIANLERLGGLGIGLAVDDFGTGCSSLACIKHLAIRRLKIDRSFIERLMTRSDDEAIVQAVIGLARSLGLAVLAEGVETAAQAELLIREGCDEAQGYFFSKAVGPEELASRYC
ncbi:bifunctional diguanylate cyclase/phosphodiesterase [Thiocapsa rosea]|uniref:PAS domain S-box-containing protein/diguanylate cyclase (GGDEF)-like protein n=1 Tax=Thiocapsa rosea TaxID=69360 RepID=A0A495V318_9GAMM|nr:bifunctional diguanylate cyclase/phosphodiesterase [Thiocapsa rosea]RKT43709.1 PAS domain S-box-containing protein/diguanylate cyclase (GGDEF)-like protein [Thiocapsa rosea]